MATEIDDQNIEYVEYMDAEEYNENEEIVAIDEDGMQQVEYIEAQQISGEIEYDIDGTPHLEGHTIFEHNGKQYMIPNELSESGQTILLEDYDDSEEISMVEEQDQEYIVTSDEAGQSQAVDSPNEEHAPPIVGEGLTPGRRYAVLRNGRLHIEGGEEGEVCQEGIEGKLQVLEESLSYQEEEITGKNLITGQTISLNGFLEKLKKKSDTFTLKRESFDSNFYPDNVKRQRRNFYQGKSPKSVVDKPNYVLMPPVNRKVLVGKTPDGKNIIGKILQIWKKVDDSVPVKPKPVRRRPQAKADPKEEIEELIIDNTGKILEVKNPDKEKIPPKNVLLKKKYVSKAFLDQNIVKTLSGLMELESVQKNLAEKNLIIKHILKKSIEGKIVPGKEITYYYGHMETSEGVDCFNDVKTQWTFVSDYKEKPSVSTGIDLNESSDTQQVDLCEGGKVTFGSLTEPEIADAVCNIAENSEAKKKEYSETVPVNLIVVEDEYGKKRTKVTIPQLGGSPKCQICNKMFRSEAHLKKHLTQHSSTGNFTCEVCGKVFYDMHALLKHNKDHVNVEKEPSEKEHVCYICGKNFTSPASLRRHITCHDHNLRPLQCMTCMQRFTDESSLKKHMLLHTGIKSFQCEVCLKCFVHQGDLNFHRKIHDPIKRYQCQTCGKQFNRHSNMLRHSEIHRGDGNGDEQPAYKCDMCGCQYNFISSLTRHIVNKHMKTDSAEAQALILEAQEEELGEAEVLDTSEIQLDNIVEQVLVSDES